MFMSQGKGEVTAVQTVVSKSWAWGWRHLHPLKELWGKCSSKCSTGGDSDLGPGLSCLFESISGWLFCTEV